MAAKRHSQPVVGSPEPDYSGFGTRQQMREEIVRLKEQLCSRENALREVYELIYLGEADNALHGLDAYMIREGIFRGEAASSPDKESKQ